MRETTNARRARRWPAYLLGPAMLVGSLAAGGTAQAATHETAQPALALVCGYQKDGTTSTISPVSSGYTPINGTVFTKPSGTNCKDLNIRYNAVAATYLGYVYNASDGSWNTCGGQTISAGTHNPVIPICLNIPVGASTAVVATNAAGTVLNPVKITVWM